MKIGPYKIEFGLKSYRELERFISLEKSAYMNDPKSRPQVQLGEYKSWVSSAVSLISKSVAKVPIKYYDSNTDEEIGSTLHGLNRLKKLMKQPNPFMTLRFIKGWMQVQWDLCGMAAAYKARNRFGEIVEIWPLNMNDYQRTVDKDGRPIETCTRIIPEDVRYIFMIGGKQYVFSIDELMLLMHPHPKYLYIGASPVQQQAFVVDVQTYIEIYERDFFKNSARVDMVLATDDELGQSKADEIKERWLAKYRGKYHDVAVLDKGLKPIPMKYTNQDFQFLELSRWSRDMVLGCYPVNPAKLGITDKVNRSNSVYVDIEYNTYTVQPRLTMWDEEFTQIAQEFDERLVIKHANPIPRDRQIEVQEARVYLGGASSYTIDEFRKTQNLKPTKNGDVILVPTKLIPLDMLRKYWDAQIKASKNLGNGSPDRQTDPSRHDGDTPHLNPDGSDDRDTLPTDGRSFNYEKYYRKIWIEKLVDYFNSDEYKLSSLKNDSILFIKNMIITTIKTYLICCNKIKLFNEEDKWINDISVKVFDVLDKTLWSEKEKDSSINYVENQFDSNPRIAKICKCVIKSCINYSKYLIFSSLQYEKVWIINDNICGHKGRLESLKSKKNFKIGDTDVRFPGEILNLNCDCAIGYEKIILLEN